MAVIAKLFRHCFPLHWPRQL